MADIETLLTRWQKAGVLDAGIAARILAYEEKQERPGGLKWQGLVALIMGGILLACGVVLFVSAHWDQIGPGARFAVVIAMVSIFHLAAGYVQTDFPGMSTTLHAVGTVSTGAAIALVGQIFNIEEHWPAAVLMWALAALVGWMLLRDQAQQTLTLLLVPAWMLCELAYRSDGRIGERIYLGRFLLVWAVLYLTFFVGSRKKVVQGILFAAGAISGIVGTAMMLEGRQSWSAEQTFIPFSMRVWAWIALAAVPMVVAAFHGHKGLMPVGLGVVYASVLPWCQRQLTMVLGYGNGKWTNTYSKPNLAAHALMAAFSIFICWWGVRRSSKALVNLGIVYFAIAVAVFYYSDILDKFDRSLGLIGLGVLFLAGGWFLEKMRRRILAGMDANDRKTQGAL